MQPYLQLLPSTHTNVLYFSVEDFTALSRSPVLFGRCARFLRTTVKHYCHLARVLVPLVTPTRPTFGAGGCTVVSPGVIRSPHSRKGPMLLCCP